MSRAIHLAQMDKTRPVLILTRGAVRPYLRRVTVAPITSAIRGLTTEVPLDPQRNGVDRPCVASCDNIHTIEVDRLGRAIGRLLPDQEQELAEAIAVAFDLANP